jgi:RNA polymerase sigma-70 factor, ECF subfamily
VRVIKLQASAAEGAEPPTDEVASTKGSFDHIYDEWFDDVSRWVRSLGARDADADDLVQDVFIVVHRRLDSFDGQNLAGWLYQIARRRVRDYRQLAWVKHFFGLHSVPPFDEVLQTRAGPLEELEKVEGQEVLRQLLATLTPDQRAAFVLFEIEGHSGEYIAKLQQVTLNTVWARMFQARRKLKQEAQRLEKRALRRQRKA